MTSLPTIKVRCFCVKSICEPQVSAVSIETSVHEVPISLESGFPLSRDTSPSGDQSSAVQVEVYQSEGCQQPSLVLLQTTITHSRKSKHALQDAEGPFHIGSYLGLGIEDVVWHSLRHTCLSSAAMSGATVKEIQELGGHLTISQAARYMHLSPTHTSNASERMAQWKPVSL